MKITKVTEDGMIIAYEENYWTGRKNITIEGKEVKKISRREFAIRDENTGEEQLATVKGSFLTGVKLLFKNGTEEVLVSNKPHESLLIFLPFLNIALGIFCGAIGGGLSAFSSVSASIVNATILRTEMNPVLKTFLCIGVFIMSFLIWVGIFVLICIALGLTFPELFSSLN